MIEEARRDFPELRFEIGDATSLAYASAFDGVFSNAVLHWIKEAEAVGVGVSRALKPGGRFVAEFGGHGNVRRLLKAVRGALASLGRPVPHDYNPWYFPTIGQYAALLERHGLEVTYAVLFDRVTPPRDYGRIRVVAEKS